MQKLIEPYKILFPLGIILGIWGALVWIPFSFQFSDYYPGIHHAFFMIGGFLLSFAAGFLMTTMPKFTGTWPATKNEISFVALPLVLLPFFSLLEQQILFYAALTISISALLVFAAKRFKNKRGMPPEPFVFIGFGLGTGWLGAILLLIQAFGFHSTNLFSFAKLLFLQAFILCLVVGVGSRLVPAFTGWGPLLTMPFSEKALPRKKAINLFLLLGIFFVVSLFIEAFYDITIGRALRTVLISGILFFFWRIYKFPPVKTRVTWGLWLAAWSLLLGLWGATLNPALSIHYYHLTFVSGLSLMTLMISTRIILGHGGHGLKLESTSKSLWIIIILAILASLTRFAAGVNQAMYLSHLAYAAITWVVAIGIWGWVIGRKIKFRA